ncbi:HAD family hydrolase [Promethearchaeum syntrophicum]|uniref:HAD family hydrolase n=1 Tax=Promethearchaeum syntrophicum TaxID=2594042 RepID=A0A5B9DE78_9ARCH|nr:HAD family hydrolase [Candidatus Prometheoarchaeum syntrophicum]QEE17619.1 2-deoxyglucose-6-phosphatase [Candidatus Prometheoarchaeum syntrophicum]
MTINCVLFDLDNTLVGIPDTWNYFDTLIQDVLKMDYDLSIPPADDRNSLWRSGKEFVSILRRWGVSDPNDFWIKFDERDGIKRKKLIKNDQLILYDDVIPTLKKLNNFGIKTGIVSNTPDFIVEYELAEFDLSPYFDTVLGLGDDQSICKPEKDGIIMVLKELECLPSNTVFIGDSQVDIIAAQRAEVIPIFIDRKKKKSRKLTINPETYIRFTNLNQIFDFIEEN